MPVRFEQSVGEEQAIIGDNGSSKAIQVKIRNTRSEYIQNG